MERLVRVLKSNNTGVCINMADFICRMDSKDHLDWEINIENYFVEASHGTTQSSFPKDEAKGKHTSMMEEHGMVKEL